MDVCCDVLTKWAARRPGHRSTLPRAVSAHGGECVDEAEPVLRVAAGGRYAGPPRLIEMTLACLRCAQAMHAATSATVPEPSDPPSALQMSSGEENAMPAMPTPLFAVAPMVPATCVPWPLSSAQDP